MYTLWYIYIFDLLWDINNMVCPHHPHPMILLPPPVVVVVVGGTPMYVSSIPKPVECWGSKHPKQFCWQGYQPSVLGQISLAFLSLIKNTNKDSRSLLLTTQKALLEIELLATVLVLDINISSRQIPTNSASPQRIGRLCPPLLHPWTWKNVRWSYGGNISHWLPVIGCNGGFLFHQQGMTSCLFPVAMIGVGWSPRGQKILLKVDLEICKSNMWSHPGGAGRKSWKTG